MSDPIIVTFFKDVAAQHCQWEGLTFAELAARIEATHALDKAGLPLVKLARFGGARSRLGSLRHTRNLIAVSGVEADYDGEKVTIEEAAETLQKALVEAILYTSPSNLIDGHGARWRVLAPFSHEYPPEERARFLARLGGLFRNGNATILAPESWTRSQSFYIGQAGDNPLEVIITEGQPIDLLDELDVLALGRPQRLTRQPGDTGPHHPGEPQAGIDDVRAALDVIPNNWVDWEEWNRLAMAAYAATGGSAEGFAAFDAWSQRSEQYDAGETEARWRHFAASPPSRIGFGSLAHWARQQDPHLEFPSAKARRLAREQDEAAAAAAPWPDPPGDKEWRPMVSREDFCAFMPTHQHILIADGNFGRRRASMLGCRASSSRRRPRPRKR
jgi:hypothetical protein